MTTTISAIIAAINRAMHEGTACPTLGCIGECPAITPQDTPNRYAAHLYLWDKTFNDSRAVARWFRTLGATEINILATIYETENDIYDGAAALDGARPWTVLFALDGVVDDCA